MKHVWKSVAPILAVALLGTGLLAQTTSAARYDGGIQTKVTQKLTDKKEFRNVKASTEDGIVTLSGRVELYQQKLDATKKVRKNRGRAGGAQPDRGEHDGARRRIDGETRAQAVLRPHRLRQCIQLR